MSDILKLKKKYLLDDAVDGDKFLLLNGQILRGLDALGDEYDLLAKVLTDANAYADGIVAAEASIRAAADTALQTAINNEVTARQADVAALGTAISTEETARIAADAALGTEIDNLETYVDATFIPLSQKGAVNGVASLDANGKIPLAQLPNSIMEYKGLYDATLNSPVLLDGAGNNASESIGDVYRVTVAGTQDFGSGNISLSVGDYLILSDSYVWEKSNSAETVSGVSSVNGLVGDVVLDATQIQMDSEAKSIEQKLIELGQEIDAEEAARIAADAALQAEVDQVELDLAQEVSNRTTADSLLQSQINDINTDVSQVQTDLATESAARIAGDSNLQSQIDSNDTDIAALQAADTNLQSQITTEETARIAADQNLQTQIDNLTAGQFNSNKEFFTIDDQTNNVNFIDLAFEADPNMLIVTVDRLVCHEGSDYTLSVVGGVTRITWGVDFAPLGTEALENGQLIVARYIY